MNTTENTTAKDIFKVVGTLIGATFSAAQFFLRLLGDSGKSEENTDRDFNLRHSNGGIASF